MRSAVVIVLNWCEIYINISSLASFGRRGSDELRIAVGNRSKWKCISCKNLARMFYILQELVRRGLTGFLQDFLIDLSFQSTRVGLP